MSGIIKRAVHAVVDVIGDRALADGEELNAASVGKPVSRIDGYLKVTGAAQYASDTLLPGMAHAVLVPSSIARGTVTSINMDEATALPGVLAILTHENVRRLHKNLVPQIGAGGWPLGGDLLPQQDDRVHYAGEPVAMVVAETLEQAMDAASRVRVTYDEEPAKTDLRRVLDDAFTPESPVGKLDYARGSAAEALAVAPVRIEQEYTTPAQTNNPLGPFATVAAWDGDQLTLYDSTQYTQNVGKSAARVLGLPAEAVRVLSPFVGGGFGAGLRAWPHTWRAAIAARVVGRPVKLVLPRAQMFTEVGRRAETVQHVSLGAERDGRLVAISHHATHDTSRDEDFLEAMTLATRSLYACPNVETKYTISRLDRSTPTYMRCPGESETLFALESALDELAIALDMDPIALRLRNYAEEDPEHRRPWSSNALRACYKRGAELFDWSRRTPAPGSMRAGNVLIGLGTASATFPASTLPAAAQARINADGSAVVRSAATDIGPGTYTALAQVAADALGLPLAHVRIELGDSEFPMSPHQGGSALMASVGSAVAEACTTLRRSAVALAAGDERSPLTGASDDEVEARAGRLHLRADPSRAERYATILARAGQESLQEEVNLPSAAKPSAHSCHSFGAQFAEVHIDVALRTIRVPRLVGVFGAGRIINPKLAHSQLMGGMIWGMSQALLEETIYDHRLNRIVNASLADYLVPVNADVQSIEAELIPEEDPYVNPLGVKGIGEIGMAGVAPAIANAVYHATGNRVRELPITIEKLLESTDSHEWSSPSLTG